VTPALAKLRSDIQDLVQQAPPIDLSTLAAASVIGALAEVIDPLADQGIDSTIPILTRQLQLQTNQLTMFKQRVSAKLKEELHKFYDKVYESELGQLLDALAQQSPQTPFLRQKLLGIARNGQEKELNAIRSKAIKLDEARRTPVRETPPPPVSLPPQPVHHQPPPPQHHQITHHQPQPTPQQSQLQPVHPSVPVSTPTPTPTPTPDPQRAQQEDAFCNAALSGDSQTVQTLLSQGVNVNCSQQGGWTALMNATLQGHATVVDILIRSGADLNLKDNGGFTALMYAASYRRYNIAEALVKAGSNLEIADNAGRNIQQYAQTDPQVKEAIQKGQAAREQQRQQTTQPTPSQPSSQPLQSYGYQQYPQGYPAPTAQPTYGTPQPTYGTPVSTPTYGTPAYGAPGTPAGPTTPQPTLAYGQQYQQTGYPAYR
jgi:predicted house-cleaning noncanonical NTP pyrophosphatase (MazG superfamily)